MEAQKDLLQRGEKDLDAIAQELIDISNEVINITSKYSEKIAEMAADIGFKNKGYEMRYPSSIEEKQGSGTVDRVYIKKDPATGRLVVVEIKGGSSKLGSREVIENNEKVRVQQGHIKYLESVANEMIDSGDKEKQNIGGQILKAIERKNIDYLLARQNFDNNGNLGDFELRKFIIGLEKGESR